MYRECDVDKQMTRSQPIDRVAGVREPETLCRERTRRAKAEAEMAKAEGEEENYRGRSRDVICGVEIDALDVMEPCAAGRASGAAQEGERRTGWQLRCE